MRASTLLLAALAGCGGDGAVVEPDADTRSAGIAITAAPNPIVEGPCAGCGPLVGQLAAVATVTVTESGGVAALVVSIAMRLHDAADTTIAEGTFDTTAVAQLAGSARVAAGGRLDIPSVGPHYDAAQGGHAATLSYTVIVRDDNGHTVTGTLDVPVIPAP